MKRNLALFSAAAAAGSIVAFSEQMLTSPAALPANAKDFVSIPGPLFTAGHYEKQDFGMTPEEIVQLCSEFAEPVKMNLEHAVSPLDGVLGQITKLHTPDGGQTLHAEYQVPAWLLAAAKEKGEPLKISPEFDKTTKKLVGAAYTVNPAIPTNVLTAAFSDAQQGGERYAKAKGGKVDEAENKDPEQKPAVFSDAAVISLLRENTALRAKEWTTAQILAGKLLPAEAAAATALFSALEESGDERLGGAKRVVKFSESASHDSLLAAFTAFVESRPPHGLDHELLDPNADAETLEAKFKEIVLNRRATEHADPLKLEGSGKSKEELLRMTPLGATVLKERATA